MKKKNKVKIAGAVVGKVVGYGLAYKACSDIPPAVAEFLMPYIGVLPACGVGICICGIEPIAMGIAFKTAHKKLDHKVVEWFKKLANEEDDYIVKKDGETYIKYQILDEDGKILKVDFAKVEGL